MRNARDGFDDDDRRVAEQLAEDRAQLGARKRRRDHDVAPPQIPFAEQLDPRARRLGATDAGRNEQRRFLSALCASERAAHLAAGRPSCAHNIAAEAAADARAGEEPLHVGEKVRGALSRVGARSEVDAERSARVHAAELRSVVLRDARSIAAHLVRHETACGVPPRCLHALRLVAAEKRAVEGPHGILGVAAQRRIAARHATEGRRCDERWRGEKNR